MRLISIAALVAALSTSPSFACTQPWFFLAGKHALSDFCSNKVTVDNKGGINLTFGVQSGSGNYANQSVNGKGNIVVDVQSGNNNRSDTTIQGNNNVAATVQAGSNGWSMIGMAGNGGTVVVLQSN